MTEYITIENDYSDQVDRLRQTYMDYPSYVTIETLALCNAACEFCPYPSLERKGDEMSTEIFEKAISDLEDIPHEFSIALCRVNEPFLDKRIFDFHKLINRRLSRAKISFFSNVSVLNNSRLEQLSEINNIEFFVISFNDHRQKEYEKVMQIPYERTIKHIDLFHKYHMEGKLNFPVLLSRVGDNSHADREFVSWCEERYPEFIVTVRPRSDWMGMTQQKGFEIPNAGCRQWFQLHFLADGRDAFCCIDAEGKFGYDQNIKDKHALEIYNLPQRIAIRKNIKLRKDLEICSKCAMYS